MISWSRLWGGPAALAPTVATKKARYRRFGLARGQNLPVAELHLRVACDKPCCRPFLVSSAAEIAPFGRPGTNPIARLFRPTAAATDLSAFATPDAYFRAVSKETAGKYNRSANKGRRAGYVTTLTGPDAHALSLHEIRASIKVRSRGPVKEAFAAPPAGLFDTDAPFPPPACDEHWRADFALFKDGDVRRSKALAVLRRCGDFVLVLHMIGHADILAVGGMKLLQFDIMDWLLRRDVGMTKGIRWLVHGAIEDGNAGLADWRRYVRQCPVWLGYDLPDEAKFPADFDPARYLDMHPGVRAAGVDPRAHYIAHGMIQGFDYK